MMLIVILALTGVAIFLLSRPRTPRSTYRGAGTRANAHGGGEFHALSSFDNGSAGSFDNGSSSGGSADCGSSGGGCD